MTTRTLYVFGNEHLAYDDAAARVAKVLAQDPQLTELNIIHCRSPEMLLEATDEELCILDVVRGLPADAEPVVITDPLKIRSRTISTMHDFDLGYFFHLLDALGTPKKARIIGISQECDPTKIAPRVAALINDSRKRDKE